MKTVSHLGPPEFQGVGLRDVTGCASQADPKADPVWEDETQTNTKVTCSQTNLTLWDGWRSKENQRSQAILSLCQALREPDVG